MTNPVTIIMIEDDEGHARLIERKLRRSGVNNEIVPFTDGTICHPLSVRPGWNRECPQGQGAARCCSISTCRIRAASIFFKRIKENKYLKSTPVGADHY